jgi:hypothetical protein
MVDEPRERFLCAPGLKLEAHERVAAVQFEQIEAALTRLEGVINRLELRLWLTVFGVVAAILSEGVVQIFNRMGQGW